MEFSTRLQVTTVIRHDGKATSVIACRVGPGEQVGLYMEVDDTELEPGDYIEINGVRVQP